MRFQIPSTLKQEHEELRGELARAATAGGRTGDAANAVIRLMDPHFAEEEEYAMPPLGLLGALSQGRVEPGMAEVLKMTGKLEAELPHLLAEHKEIEAALEALTEAAKAENMPDYTHLAEKVRAHARTEEEVTYPAVLLIGRYLKAALPHAAGD